MHCLEPELSLDEDKRDQHCSCPRVQQTFTKASHCWLSVLLVFKKISGCSPTKKKITKTSKCPWQEWTLKSKLILSPNEDSLLIGILLLLLLENAPELQSSPKGFFFFFSLFFAPFISCEGPYFPLSCHLCTRRKYPCLLRKWTSISKWLTVYLQFNCFLNLNRLISSSKLNKKEDLKKKKKLRKKAVYVTDFSQFWWSTEYPRVNFSWDVLLLWNAHCRLEIALPKEGGMSSRDIKTVAGNSDAA